MCLLLFLSSNDGEELTRLRLSDDSYAVSLAKRGAKVVINDLGPSTQDKNRKAAEVVVEEITKSGGEAIANLDSNLDGDKIVKQAMDKWGRVDILINNAGILRDKSFKSMSDAEWDAITAVHITGSYKCAHAAWPIMRKQKVRTRDSCLFERCLAGD